jgi:hypothetical protein
MCYLQQKYENMVTRCLFGIFVFGPDITLTYRFLTDDLFSYLYQTFREHRDPSDDGHVVRIFLYHNRFILFFKF